MSAMPFFNSIDLNGNEIRNFTPQRSATPPLVPTTSPLYVDTSSSVHKFMFYDGSAYIDLGAVPATGFTPRGTIDASANPAYPAAPQDGDVWLITVAGTVGGETVEAGEMLYRVGGQWVIQQTNLVAATDTQAGFIRIATQTEVNTGTDNTTVVTPLTLAGRLAAQGYARKFAVEITGDNTTTDFAVNHALASTDVITQVRGVTSNSVVFVDTENTDANNVTLKFAVPPATGVRYRVVVIG